MQMGVSGSAPLERRWMKHWAAAGTDLPYLRPVASMEVDSPRTQFFWVSRNKVVAQASRKPWSGVSRGITPVALWNCMSRKQHWVVHLCNPVLVYSQDRRQKNRPICIRSYVHCALGDVSACSPILMTSPRGVVFYLLEGGSAKE